MARLGEAKRQGELEAELRRLSFVPLIVVDEVGYIPFDPEAANLMFSLVSARYERASMIVTSNKPFSAWGEIFGDEVVAAAMIDRLVHHAEILGLKGDSYRLATRTWARRRPATERSPPAPLRPTGSLRRRDLHSSAGLSHSAKGGSILNRQKGVRFQPALTLVGAVSAQDPCSALEPQKI